MCSLSEQSPDPGSHFHPLPPLTARRTLSTHGTLAYYKGGRVLHGKKHRGQVSVQTMHLPWPWRRHDLHDVLCDNSTEHCQPRELCPGLGGQNFDEGSFVWVDWSWGRAQLWYLQRRSYCHRIQSPQQAIPMRHGMPTSWRTKMPSLSAARLTFLTAQEQ